MIRRSRGSVKETKRCPYCGFENMPMPPLGDSHGQKLGALIVMSCRQCGQHIICNRKEWQRLGWTIKEEQ